MMESIDIFLAANKLSPIVEAEWLGKDKKPATSSDGFWFFRVRLQNESVFVLTREEVQGVESFRWAGIPAEEAK